MSQTNATTDRGDKTLRDRNAFDCLRAELSQAFAAPEESYVSLTAAEVIARNPCKPVRSP